MDSKKAIILIPSLLAMVLLFSLEVSARVFAETSSNTKMDNVEKTNEANKASYVNGGYSGYPYNGGGYSSGYQGNGGGYIGSYYPGIGGGNPGNVGGYYPGIGGGYPGNAGGYNPGIAGGYYGNGGYRGGYPMSGGSYLGNGGGYPGSGGGVVRDILGGVIPGNFGVYNIVPVRGIVGGGGVYPGIVGAVETKDKNTHN